MSWLESGTLRCASLTTDILYYFVPWSVETLKWWSYSNKDLFFFFFFFFFFLACCAWRYLKIRVLYVPIRTVWRKIKKASNVSPRWGRNPYLIVEMCSFNTLSSRKADGNNREISSKSLFFFLQPNVIYINTPWNMFLITLKCNRWTLLSFNPPPLCSSIKWYWRVFFMVCYTVGFGCSPSSQPLALQVEVPLAVSPYCGIFGCCEIFCTLVTQVAHGI